jgi:hypothetical protein
MEMNQTNLFEKMSYSRVVVSKNYHLHAIKDVILKNE